MFLLEKTEMDHLYLNFLGFGVQINCENIDLLKRLTKDFSYFVSSKKGSEDLVIDFFWKDPKELKIPESKSSRQTHLCISYDFKNLRYIDYHGKVRSLFDFGQEKAKLFSLNLEKSHEVLYLLILSRVGKALDLAGLHRIHSFGVFYRGSIALGIMPSKCGKSTLLKSLLSDDDVELVSDDTPLVDRFGNIHAFPIRLGAESEISQDMEIIDPDKNLYILDREFWGKKYLLSVDGLKNRIFKNQKSKRIYLFFGVRYSGAQGKLIKVSKFYAARRLFFDCVIGFGLPIVIEYFWERGTEDFFRKSKIALSRAFACMNLLLKSESYEIQLGSDLNFNQKLIKEKLRSTS